ncbi:unnamed protein product [Adineta ricciae]|uniref:Uncharacterized protein n=1 Tax=Adineta ricciae TaxID=249248 RepID=A0A814U273_ADIRI|nr:unnamed protein product [Adineta ricciae]CAF1549666.1 unnamed protein product [Adineta ricciae]
MGNCTCKWCENSLPLDEVRCTHEGEEEKIEQLRTACSTDDLDTVIDLLPQLCETTVRQHRYDFLRNINFIGGNNNIVRLVREYQDPFRYLSETERVYENANQQISVDRADIATYLRFIGTAPFFLRPLIRISIERQCLDHFSQIVEQAIQNNGKDLCNNLKNLWQTFMKGRCIKSFLRIYTLSRPTMSTIIQNKSSSYASLIYMNLHNIECRQRAYNGISYRGEFISARDLITYRGAKGKEILVEIKNFYSTSKSQNIALMYGANPDENDYKFPALYIFDFTEKSCSTAIDLVKEPVISEIPDEEEVLLLPYTMFRVVDVRKAGYIDDSGCNRWIIELKNITVPRRNLMSFMWERTDLKAGSKPDMMFY